MATREQELEKIDVYTQYKKHIIIWEVAGILAIFGIGSVFHFMFEWIGTVKAIGWLFPINEATWEHTKMSFWTGLIFYVVQYFVFGKKFKKFIVSKTVGLYSGILAMLSFWYTVKGTLGPEGYWFGIVNYLFAVLVQQGISWILYSLRWEMDEKRQKILDIISLVAVGILIVAMILFTYVQPQLPVFYDAHNDLYGFIE